MMMIHVICTLGDSVNEDGVCQVEDHERCEQRYEFSVLGDAILEGPHGDLCEHIGEDEYRRHLQLRVDWTREGDIDSHKCILT